MCQTAPGASGAPGTLAVNEGVTNQGLTRSLAAPTVNAGASPTMSSVSPGLTSPQLLQALMAQLQQMNVPGTAGMISA